MNFQNMLQMSPLITNSSKRQLINYISFQCRRHVVMMYLTAPSSSDEVTNEWSYTFKTTLHLHGMHRDKYFSHIKVTVAWDVKPHSLVDRPSWSCLGYFLFYPKDAGSEIPQNTATNLPDCTVSHLTSLIYHSGGNINGR
jgi:hypothetical protein